MPGGLLVLTIASRPLSPHLLLPPAWWLNTPATPDCSSALAQLLPLPSSSSRSLTSSSWVLQASAQTPLPPGSLP